jgi:hypothetical protein
MHTLTYLVRLLQACGLLMLTHIMFCIAVLGHPSGQKAGYWGALTNCSPCKHASQALLHRTLAAHSCFASSTAMSSPHCCCTKALHPVSMLLPWHRRGVCSL